MQLLEEVILQMDHLSKSISDKLSLLAGSSQDPGFSREPLVKEQLIFLPDPPSTAAEASQAAGHLCVLPSPASALILMIVEHLPRSQDCAQGDREDKTTALGFSWRQPLSGAM